MNETKTIRAKVRYKSSRGGLQLEGYGKDWFNPTTKTSSEVERIHTGMHVILKHINGNIVSIEEDNLQAIPEDDGVVNGALPGANVHESITPKGKAMLEEAKSSLTQDRKIVRQTCLKAASELWSGKATSTEQVLASAEMMEEWVYR